MKITQAHVAYWQHHKQPLPTWAPVARPRPPTIHTLINTQCQHTTSYEYEAANTLAILKSWRKRDGTVIHGLHTMAQGSAHGPRSRRAKYCKRWLRALASREARDKVIRELK